MLQNSKLPYKTTTVFISFITDAVAHHCNSTKAPGSKLSKRGMTSTYTVIFDEVWKLPGAGARVDIKVVDPVGIGLWLLHNPAKWQLRLLTHNYPFCNR